MTPHIDLDLDAREALAERLVNATTHALETLSVHLGLELGLYQALNDLGAATQAEVAARAGIAPRYAQEWLEQQATAGYLACHDPAGPAQQRRYQLPPVMARCSWTPTAPTTPRRSRSPSQPSSGCCRSCWRPTAAAAASPTPPTAPSCGTASPRATGRCSSTS